MSDFKNLKGGRIADGSVDFIGLSQAVRDAIAAGMNSAVVLRSTYDELKKMKDGAGLVSGQLYLLSDYQTIHTIPMTTDICENGVTQSQTDFSRNFALNGGEPLLLQATSTSSFSTSAYSPLFPQDIITYHFDVIDYETPTLLLPGRIEYREDTLADVSAYYDWRTARFRRYKFTAPIAPDLRTATLLPQGFYVPAFLGEKFIFKTDTSITSDRLYNGTQTAKLAGGDTTIEPDTYYHLRPVTLGGEVRYLIIDVSAVMLIEQSGFCATGSDYEVVLSTIDKTQYQDLLTFNNPTVYTPPQLTYFNVHLDKYIDYNGVPRIYGTNTVFNINNYSLNDVHIGRSADIHFEKGGNYVTIGNDSGSNTFFSGAYAVTYGNDVQNIYAYRGFFSINLTGDDSNHISFFGSAGNVNIYGYSTNLSSYGNLNRVDWFEGQNSSFLGDLSNVNFEGIVRNSALLKPVADTTFTGSLDGALLMGSWSKSVVTIPLYGSIAESVPNSRVDYLNYKPKNFETTLFTTTVDALAVPTISRLDGSVSFTPGNVGSAVSKTYDELKALKDTAMLVLGQTYLLSDYQTIHTIPMTTDICENGVTQSQTDFSRNFALNGGEPLLLQATSTSSFSTTAYSPSFPQDIITYHFDAADYATPTLALPGRIEYREDTLADVSTYYDWRTARFRRYKFATPALRTIALVPGGFSMSFNSNAKFIFKTDTIITSDSLFNGSQHNKLATGTTTLEPGKFYRLHPVYLGKQLSYLIIDVSKYMTIEQTGFCSTGGRNENALSTPDKTQYQDLLTFTNPRTTIAPNHAYFNVHLDKYTDYNGVPRIYGTNTVFNMQGGTLYDIRIGRSVDIHFEKSGNYVTIGDDSSSNTFFSNAYAIKYANDIQNVYCYAGYFCIDISGTDSGNISFYGKAGNVNIYGYSNNMRSYGLIDRLDMFGVQESTLVGNITRVNFEGFVVNSAVLGSVSETTYSGNLTGAVLVNDWTNSVAAIPLTGRISETVTNSRVDYLNYDATTFESALFTTTVNALGVPTVSRLNGSVSFTFGSAEGIDEYDVSNTLRYAVITGLYNASNEMSAVLIGSKPGMRFSFETYTYEFMPGDAGLLVWVRVGKAGGGALVPDERVLEFVFAAGFPDTYTALIGTNQTGIYATSQLSNVASVSFQVNNGTPSPNTPALAVGNTLHVTITRANAALGAVLTLTSKAPPAPAK